MIPDITRDPPRDAELAARLRELETTRPGDRVDWTRLRRTTLVRAADALARLRQRGSWWEYAARWARPAIPLAAAAGLALAVLLGTLHVPQGAVGPLATLPFLEEVLIAPIPEPEAQLLYTAGAEPDALLRLAIQEP
jgi:hypothetical protein